MAKAKKSETVPKAMQAKFDGIVAITNDFAKTHLNDEYAQLIRFVVAALCRKRPSPLAKGRDKTWACGITHAIGMVNFLFDPSHDANDVTKATMASLGLSENDVFGYWFDFGDDWWHQVNVIAIKDKAPKGKYPKVTQRIGASPPQYADFD